MTSAPRRVLLIQLRRLGDVVLSTALLDDLHRAFPEAAVDMLVGAAAAPLLGYIITGSFIVENIFGVPGIGRYYVTAVSARDYSVVMGLTVLLSIIVIAANLLVDVLYGILDPRTREAKT